MRGRFRSGRGSFIEQSRMRKGADEAVGNSKAGRSRRVMRSEFWCRKQFASVWIVCKVDEQSVKSLRAGHG